MDESLVADVSYELGEPLQSFEITDLFVYTTKDRCWTYKFTDDGESCKKELVHLQLDRTGSIWKCTHRANTSISAAFNKVEVHHIDSHKFFWLNQMKEEIIDE